MLRIEKKIKKLREVYTFHNLKIDKTSEDIRMCFYIVKRIYKLEQKLKELECNRDE